MPVIKKTFAQGLPISSYYYEQHLDFFGASFILVRSTVDCMKL